MGEGESGRDRERGKGEEEKECVTMYTYIAVKLYKHSKADTGRKGLGCIPKSERFIRSQMGNTEGLPHQQLH